MVNFINDLLVVPYTIKNVEGNELTNHVLRLLFLDREHTIFVVALAPDHLSFVVDSRQNGVVYEG